MRHDDRDEPLGITIGEIKLLYVVKFPHSSGRGRGFIACFELSDQKYLVALSETELLTFAKFRLRVLEVGHMMVRHPADGECAAGRRQWTSDVATAIAAAARITVGGPEFDGSKWIGGRH